MRIQISKSTNYIRINDINKHELQKFITTVIVKQITILYTSEMFNSYH